MTNPKEIIADWVNTCEALALEYWQNNSEDYEPSEYAHECADSCQWVVYYSHAWNLVSAVREIHPRDLDQAESDLEDLGFSFESLDKTMCLLAYWLTYNEILTQINEQEESNND